MSEERKIITTNIGSPLEIDTDYSYDKPTDIDEVKTFIEEAIKKGANKIKFSGTSEYETYYNLETLSIQPVLEEEESDKNYEFRMNRERSNIEASKNVKKAQRRELYEELKEEFKD